MAWLPFQNQMLKFRQERGLTPDLRVAYSINKIEEEIFDLQKKIFVKLPLSKFNGFKIETISWVIKSMWSARVCSIYCLGVALRFQSHRPTLTLFTPANIGLFCFYLMHFSYNGVYYDRPSHHISHPPFSSFQALKLPL